MDVQRVAEGLLVLEHIQPPAVAGLARLGGLRVHQHHATGWGEGVQDVCGLCARVCIQSRAGEG